MEDYHIEEHIRNVIANGYDICIPGGTGKNGENASFCGLGVRLSKKSFGLIIIPVRRKSFERYLEEQKGNDQFKLEDPQEIARREIKEETNISIDMEKTYFLADRIEQDARPGHENKFHRKYLFMAEKYNTKSVRTICTSGEPNLGIPFVAPLWLIKKYVWERHRWMLPHIEIYAKFRRAKFPPMDKQMSLFPHNLIPALAS